jgi:Zn-dependent protease with chaperone function
MSAGAPLTKFRALSKAVFLVVLFPFVCGSTLLIALIYGLLATTALLFAYGLLMALLALLLQALHLMSGPISQQGFSEFGYLALAVDLLLIAILVFITLLTFVGCPVRLRRALQLSSVGDAGAARKLAELSREVAAALAVMPFTHLVPVRHFYVGGFMSFRRKVLVADPRLLELLNQNELAAIIAHEYAHFEAGMSISYAFVRRCLMAAQFLDFEIESGGEKTFFKRAIRVATWPMPADFIKEHFRRLFYHIARVISRMYSLVTRQAIRFSRREFYDAEFFADGVALKQFGAQPLASGLARVSFLQLGDAFPGETYDTLWKKWSEAFQKSTSTHPSIHLRMSRFENGKDNFDFQLMLRGLHESVTVKTAGSADSREEPEDGPAAFAQALCYPQLEVAKR